VDGGIGLVESCAWSLFFDGSVSSRGQGVGYIIMSPNGKSFEASVRLDFEGTNNHVEYEALHCGLEHLIDMGGGVDVEVYGDRCIDIIGRLDSFCIIHVPRNENGEANMLAQWASGYEITKGLFRVKGKLALLEAQKRGSAEQSLVINQVRPTSSNRASDESVTK
jgi:hypothetical protein